MKGLDFRTPRNLDALSYTKSITTIGLCYRYDNVSPQHCSINKMCTKSQQEPSQIQTRMIRYSRIHPLNHLLLSSFHVSLICCIFVHSFFVCFFISFLPFFLLCRLFAFNNLTNKTTAQDALSIFFHLIWKLMSSSQLC